MINKKLRIKNIVINFKTFKSNELLLYFFVEG